MSQTTGHFTCPFENRFNLSIPASVAGIGSVTVDDDGKLIVSMGPCLITAPLITCNVVIQSASEVVPPNYIGSDEFTYRDGCQYRLCIRMRLL